ncbi:MAG: prepilin-type N-terminal cleavage/methylation domain-containing protein [Gemmatimonadales bacterium]
MPTDPRGVTLIEVLLALALIGLLVGLAFGTAGRWADRARVELATAQLLDAYRRTQSVARAWGRPAELVVTADSLVVRAVWHAESTEVWRGPGPAQAGVVLTPGIHVTQFLPSGIASGVANVTHSLARGAARRQLVVSRLGRIRIS